MAKRKAFVEAAAAAVVDTAEGVVADAAVEAVQQAPI